MCTYFYWMQTCDIDMDDEIHKNSQKAPYVIAIGEHGKDITQYFIICEQAQLCECKSLLDSLIDLIATFYVFDIAYPSQLAAVFLFLQQSVLGIKDRYPPSLLDETFVQSVSLLFRRIAVYD